MHAYYKGTIARLRTVSPPDGDFWSLPHPFHLAKLVEPLDADRHTVAVRHVWMLVTPSGGYSIGTGGTDSHSQVLK